MTVTITRIPRDDLLLRANEIINPRLGSYDYWQSSGSGNANASDTYSASAGTLEKYWLSAPSNVNDAGWFYSQASWSGVAQKTASANIYFQGWQPKMVVKFFHYRQDQLLAANKGPDFQLLYESGKSSGEQRIYGTSTSPEGTTRTDIQFCAVAGNNPPQGQGMALRKVLLEPGSNTQATYFDGSTYANGNGTQRTVWEGSADRSRSLLYDQDPNNVMQPQFVEGYKHTRPTRNRFFETLDGQQAIVQQSSGWRQGVLKLMFDGNGAGHVAAREACQRAEGQHMRKGTFTYVDDTLPGLASFQYAVNGDLALYPSESRKVWNLDVPFREV